MKDKKPKAIKVVGIIAKSNLKQHKKVLDNLIKYLKKKKKTLIFDETTSEIFGNEDTHNRESVLRLCDLAIVLGGDGTLLKTARCTGKKKTLVLGVNMGTLGFLTECNVEKMYETLDKIFAGHYSIDRRSLLRTTIYRDNQKIDTYLALNDAVINQGAFARLIAINLEINNRQVARIEADGLIVSTPTGSTAHSLSAGASIVHPKIEGLVMTPLCPRALAMRPIILPDNRQIKATIETSRMDERATIGLTLDGQDSMNLRYGDVIKFRRSKRYFYMVRTKTQYYRTLRKKLKWGVA